VTPGSPPDARARRWSVRFLAAFATLDHFDVILDQFMRQLLAGKPSNFEMKIFVRPKVEATLSPSVMTDRDVVMIFDDTTAGLRWGVWFQGLRYLMLFERWLMICGRAFPAVILFIRAMASIRASSIEFARNSAPSKQGRLLSMNREIGRIPDLLPKRAASKKIAAGCALRTPPPDLSSRPLMLQRECVFSSSIPSSPADCRRGSDGRPSCRRRYSPPQVCLN